MVFYRFRSNLGHNSINGLSTLVSLGLDESLDLKSVQRITALGAVCAKARRCRKMNIVERLAASPCGVAPATQKVSMASLSSRERVS